MLLALAGRLLAAPSGIGFVYEALDLVCSVAGLDDAILVLDDTSIGRQVFRRCRRASSKRGGWVETVSAEGAGGLHVVPGEAVSAPVAAYVTSMATSALRMDLLRHDASRDPLTGLLNRRSYEQALEEAVARTRRYGWPFALVVIDLDDFKTVNDEHGHAAGDAALRVIGAEMRGVLRRGDVAARLGGDEFALIVLNVDSPAVLGTVSERLAAALEATPATAEVRFSAGIACYPREAADAEHLQGLADARMYAAKGKEPD